MAFFEKILNGSIFTNVAPHFEAHHDYLAGRELSDCGYIFQLIPEQRCDFVNETVECQEIGTLINYVEILFCNMNQLAGIGIGMMIAWIVFLCIVIAVNAEMIFVPSLLAMARKLQLTEYMTGLVLLATANEMAFLLSQFIKYNIDTTIAYNVMLGSSMLTTGLIGGIIYVIHPFDLIPEYFNLTNFAYVLAIVWIMIIDYDEAISLEESILGISVYVIYLAIIFFLHFRDRRKHKDSKLSRQDTLKNSTKRRKRVSYLHAKVGLNTKRSMASESQITEDIPDGIRSGPNAKIFQQFFSHLSLLKNEPWSIRSVSRKIYIILSAIARILLVFLVPIVDNEMPMDGWCKLGFIVNIIVLPLLVLFIIYVTNWLWYAIALGVSLVLAIIIFFTTRTDRRPVWHDYLSFFSCAVSVGLIFCAASEVVASLRTLFTLMRVDRQTVAVTAMALGFSLADVIANLYLAISGYYKMASAACYGGPLMNILVGIGLTSTLRTIGGLTKTRSGTMGYTTMFYLLCLVLISWLATLFTNYQARRSIGILKILIYLHYLLGVILIEFQTIHPYGTDHYDEIGLSFQKN